MALRQRLVEVHDGRDEAGRPGVGWVAGRGNGARQLPKLAVPLQARRSAMGFKSFGVGGQASFGEGSAEFGRPVGQLRFKGWAALGVEAPRAARPCGR